MNLDEELEILFRQLFDSTSSTYTYLIADVTTRSALLVNPVSEQVGQDRQLLQALGSSLRYCIETHIHADLLDKWTVTE